MADKYYRRAHPEDYNQIKLLSPQDLKIFTKKLKENEKSIDPISFYPFVVQLGIRYDIEPLEELGINLCNFHRK